MVVGKWGFLSPLFITEGDFPVDITCSLVGMDGSRMVILSIHLALIVDSLGESLIGNGTCMTKQICTTNVMLAAITRLLRKDATNSCQLIHSLGEWFVAMFCG